MKLTNREKAIIIIASIVVFGLLYFRFVLMPINRELVALKADKQKKQLMIEQAKGKDIRLNAINKEIERIDKEATDKKNAVSIPVRVPEVLDELDIAAANNNLIIDNILFSGDLAAIKGEFKETGGGGGEAQQNVEDMINSVQTATDSGSKPQEDTTPTSNPAKLKELTIDFSYSGTYENLVKFLSHYEENQRLFTTDILDIKFSADTCTGELSLKTYALPSDDTNFLYLIKSVNDRTIPFK
jgi:Tfp pilus assembly protein PilO